MLTTSKTPTFAYLRKVAVLPMLAFILALFSIQLSAQKPKAKKENVTQFTVTMRSDSTTFADPKTGKKVFSVATRDMPPPPPPAAAPGATIPPTPPDIKSIKVDTMEIRGTRNGKVVVIGSYYENTSAKDQANIVLTPFSGQKDKPLIVIDGVINSEMNMNDIKPNDIKSINILKGDPAKAKYADKGANGVIEITTKKP
jgi:TonB-dependent SusC/RagA subfamily outer membrane receptor